MGLTRTVGPLARLGDTPAVGQTRHSFHITARAMAAACLPPQLDPAVPPPDPHPHGYSLPTPRQIAGLAWQHLPIPTDHIPTGAPLPQATALFTTATAACAPDRRQSLFARLLGEKPSTKSPLPTFLHPILHSDANGFYVPTDFPQSLIPLPVPRGTGALWPLGSVPRLAAELDTLAQALELSSPHPDRLLETWFDPPRPAHHPPLAGATYRNPHAYPPSPSLPSFVAHRGRHHLLLTAPP